MELNNLPTPIEIFTDPISLFIIGMYLFLFLWEAIFPARKHPLDVSWMVRGLSSFVIYFLLSSYLPLLTDGVLVEYQLVDLSQNELFLQVIAGVFIFQLATWGWHRLMHASDTLWRTFHQMHHSAERLDSFGTFYFSLFDMIAWTLLGSISLVLVVGLLPQAATAVLLIVTFMAMFTHANINTPTWLGYIIERPESHSVHHERGRHQQNYCELPLIDMIFGTFANPKEHSEAVGFYEGASKRVIDMHLLRDVHSSRVLTETQS